MNARGTFLKIQPDASKPTPCFYLLVKTDGDHAGYRVTVLLNYVLFVQLHFFKLSSLNTAVTGSMFLAPSYPCSRGIYTSVSFLLWNSAINPENWQEAGYDRSQKSENSEPDYHQHHLFKFETNVAQYFYFAFNFHSSNLQWR